MNNKIQNSVIVSNDFLHKEGFHTALVWLFFLISWINSTLLTVWMIFNLAYVLFTQGRKHAVEFLIFLQLRSLLNPGIASPIEEASIVKWICVFGISLFIIVVCAKEIDLRIQHLILWFGVFGVYLCVAAFFTSSYPVVAVFKVISYLVPFCAVLMAVYTTHDQNWIYLINRYLGALVLGSVFTYTFSVAFLRNGRSFQGFFNHPNTFGVIVALFAAGLLYECNTKKKSMIQLAILAVCAVMLYTSYSRTGMFSFVAILFISILSSQLKRKEKLVFIICIGLLVFLVILINDNWRSEIIKFIYKGSDSIFSSRNDQINNNIKRFYKSPFFGTGFNVPYKEGILDYHLSFDLITENGNLFMALLGDTGVFGTILFFINYGQLFYLGKKNPNGYTIFASSFLVSMGEMAFFSTNNFGIILYFYFAIYLSDGLRYRLRGEGNE